jgi:Uma2 family endonuclease
MPTRTLLTFERFEQFQEDGHKHELLRREHIVLQPPKSDHSDLQHMLLRVLQPYVDQHSLGDVRIEVASDSNTAAQLDLKLELYFAHGAEEVWVVYPQTRRVRAHFPDGHSETLTNGLQSALFPGLAAPLSAIFAD